MNYRQSTRERTHTEHAMPLYTLTGRVVWGNEQHKKSEESVKAFIMNRIEHLGSFIFSSSAECV